MDLNSSFRCMYEEEQVNLLIAWFGLFLVVLFFFGLVIRIDLSSVDLAIEHSI
jgi:hypothetical protein